MCKIPGRPRRGAIEGLGRARPGHFMLWRQGTPAELIKICSSSKDEAREGLSMLTVPRAEAFPQPCFYVKLTAGNTDLRYTE